MYNPEGKTVDQVIKETREMQAKYEIERPASKLFIFKKYNYDCTSIVTDEKGKYYIHQLHDLYGPWSTPQLANKFRKVLNYKSDALHQASMRSW